MKYLTIFKRFISTILVLTLALNTLLVPVYAALDNCNEAYLRNIGVTTLNCTGDTPAIKVCATTAAVNLSGNDNIEKVFRFFIAKGLTAEQAAGVTGNAIGESQANPKSVGKNYSGLFQWDNGGRFANLKKWTQGKGLDSSSLEGQLEFAWYEAGERGNISGLQKQTAVDMATWFWGRFFEVAVIGGSTSVTPLTNVQNLSGRTKAANSVFAKFSRATGATGIPASADSSASGSSCTGDGQNTQFIDGFTVYSQYDPVWANLPYSSSTIKTSGCGPSAMAMIITNLTKQPVTPVMTAQYAASKGMYKPGVGSSWSIGPELAEHWGLKSQAIGADIPKITQALQAGGLVITAGAGALPFSSGGHFIVIRGVTANGKFKIGDSGHKDTSDKEWDPQQLLVSMLDHAGSVYAIYK